MAAKKRYAQVGVGGRARFFYTAVGGTYSETSEIVAFCDINHTRLLHAQKTMMDKFGYPEIPLYGADEFEKMIAEANFSDVDSTVVSENPAEDIRKTDEQVDFFHLL